MKMIWYEITVFPFFPLIYVQEDMIKLFYLLILVLACMIILAHN